VATNLLMVSIIEGKTHLLNLKRRVKSGEVIDKPIFDADPETLDEKCKKANEIIITSDFPSCNYFWGRFPRVGRRFLKEVVVREARQTFGYAGAVRAAYNDLGLVMVDGAAKRELSCVVADEADVSYIENDIYAKYKSKISQINALPVALCAAVSHTQQPSGDFMVIAVGESSTTMAIGSPNGDVKVARNIPIGMWDENDTKNAAFYQNFFNEIEKDITNTTLYYMQNFPGAECNRYYMLGSPALENALTAHGADSSIPNIQFGFSQPPIASMDKQQATAWAYIYGALYCHRQYNLLSKQIILTRNFNRGHKFAVTAIAAAILGFGLYLYQIDPVGADRITKYKQKNAELAAVQTEVVDLECEVNTLNRFSGWETFYRNTYKNQPAWGKLFSELAHGIPKEIIIDDFRIIPTAGRGVSVWNGIITGNINVGEWDNGLRLLRKFGGIIHNSPHFKILKVRYTPAEDGQDQAKDEIIFDFQINAQLTPQDTQ